MLKSSNWMPWQQRMFTVLRHLGLDKYIVIENVWRTTNRGNGVKETPEVHPNRFSNGWCRNDLHLWCNDSGRCGTRCYSPTIMMVSLRNPKVDREHSRRGEIIQRTTSNRQIYGNHRSSTKWRTRCWMVVKIMITVSHHYRNHETYIIRLLISDREATYLLSGPRFDERGGELTGENDGRCIMYSQR